MLLHLFIVEKSFPPGDGSALPVGRLRRYVMWLLPVNLILLPAIILIHEGNFLLFIPMHGMITLTILRMTLHTNITRAVLWTGLLYLPAVLSFGAVYLTGTPGYQTLVDICQKWLPVGAIQEGSCVLPPDKLSGSTLPGSFNPMEWSLSRAAGITLTVISMNWIAWICILPTLGVSLWYLIRQAIYSILRSRFPQSFSPQAARRYSGLFFRLYFLIPLLLSLPIYFSAYDYGRWFTVTSINVSMLAVSMNLPCLGFAHFQKEAGEKSIADNSQEHLDNRLVFISVSIIICVLAIVLVLPHYCLFRCDILRSPLDFFSHAYTAR